MLSKSPIEREFNDSRMSEVMSVSWWDCFRIGDIVMTVMIMIVSAMSASIVKNCAVFFIRSICRCIVVLFYFRRL